jgi:CheY-like chemotaxis protein
MYTSQELSRELPYLRRFSRALCGSQERGDAEIEFLLNRSLADRALLIGEGSPRLVLFRALVRAWKTATGGNALCEQVLLGQYAGADRSLASITPRARQAFLLSSLESFTTVEITQILEINIDELGDLLREARDQIAQQSATTVLIIEDELFIAIQLEQLVTGMGHWVQGIARTRNEALSEIANMKQYLARPGLILADIQLADGSSGIDAVNDILGDGSIPVVFITAYPERLLTGRGLEPTYLLNKPFTDDALKAVISQALFFSAGAGSRFEASSEARVACGI